MRLNLITHEVLDPYSRVYSKVQKKKTFWKAHKFSKYIHEFLISPRGAISSKTLKTSEQNWIARPIIFLQSDSHPQGTNKFTRIANETKSKSAPPSKLFLCLRSAATYSHKNGHHLHQNAPSEEKMGWSSAFGIREGVGLMEKEKEERLFVLWSWICEWDL